MEYGNVKGVEKRISRIVEGSMVLSLNQTEAAFEQLDAVFELGCNAIDTGHVYGGGKNDRLIGAWMEARDNREEMVILGKGAHHNADRRRVTDFDIKSDLFDTLARMKTDYVDIYVLHRDDPSVPVGPIVEALNEHLDAGRIHAFGGSNWHFDRIREANEYADAHGLIPFAVSSPNLCLAEQIEEPWEGCLSLSGDQGVSARAWYQETQMPLFTWSSLAQGFFSGRLTRDNFEEMKAQKALTSSCIHAYCYEPNFQRLDRAHELAQDKGATVPQVALAFNLSLPLNTFSLIGCATGQEMEANIQALALELTQEEVDWLDLKSETR